MELTIKGGDIRFHEILKDDMIGLTCFLFGFWMDNHGLPSSGEIFSPWASTKAKDRVSLAAGSPGAALECHDCHAGVPCKVHSFCLQSGYTLIPF